MTSPPCANRWLFDAIRDQRVSGAEQAAFDRHLETCGDCTEHARKARASQARLLELPHFAPDPFTARRQRRALLLALDASVLPSQRRHVPRVLWLGAGLAVAAVAWLGTRQLLRAPAATPTAASPAESVLAPPITEVRRHGIALPLTVALEQSTAAPSTPRAQLDSTQPAPLDSIQPAPRSVRIVSQGPALLRPERPSKVATADHEGARPASVAPAATYEAEDTAYLALLDLLRSGSRAAARVAAAEYLTRYPRGFRRLEALDIQKRLERIP